MKIRSLIFLACIIVSSCSNQKNEKMEITENNYFDNNGSIFKKLYKKNNEKTYYWETWNESEITATIHWGEIGNLGDKKTIKCRTHLELKNRINSLVENQFNKGYYEIDYDEHYTIEFILELKTWGTVEDLDKREAIRNILNEHLGWTGNGDCGDADIGSGEMTLFADVVKPEVALKTVKAEIERNKIADKIFARVTRNGKVIKEKFKL
jgi:predicted DNA-binding WGR domain protein